MISPAFNIIQIKSFIIFYILGGKKPPISFQHETVDTSEGNVKAAFGVLKVADLQAHNMLHRQHVVLLVDRLFSEFI